MEFGIHITAQQPINEIVEIYQRAEKMGISYGYAADEAPSAPYRDPFVVLAALGYGTKTMKLGTAINVPYTRHPALLAYAMKSFDEIFPGRMMIGLGPGGVLSLKPLGIKIWDRPLTAIREAVTICRSLFNGENVSFEGKIFQLHDTKLFAAPKTPIPIHLAARGPMMLQLTGEIADGVLCGQPLNTIEWMKEQIHIGAKRGNRSLDSFMWTNRLPFSIAKDREKARDAVRPNIIPRVAYAHPKAHELSGVDLDTVTRLKAAVGDGYSASTDVVTEEMITMYSNSGTPEDIIEQLALLQKQGIQQYIFGPPFGPNITMSQVEQLTSRFGCWERAPVLGDLAQLAMIVFDAIGGIDQAADF